MSEAKTGTSNPFNPPLAPEDINRLTPTYVTRRFEKLEDLRTVEQLSPRLTIERPTDAVIEALQQDDSRIDVVHKPQHGNLWEAVADKLDKDFSSEEVIALRTVEASLDGLVSNGKIEVHDLRDILREGEILGRDYVNLGGFHPGKRGSHSAIHERVMQYGEQTGWFRTVRLDGVGGSERVFPVLLIYDQSKMGDISGYSASLPKNPVARARVIRKAYVLDTLISDPGFNKA